MRMEMLDVPEVDQVRKSSKVEDTSGRSETSYLVLALACRPHRQSDLIYGKNWLVRLYSETSSD